ncbi:hypothetical protein SynBIOSE41_02346 [Synechococcus sp. BIOS-E4-1]|nr:hypothetical protein SynBIOSE41_02346 [Synechococcus sp. BIOS-E4-1]
MGGFVGGLLFWTSLKTLAVIGVDRPTVQASGFDLELPEGATKRGFVSGYKAGLRHLHDSHPKSKESQIRALEKGCHQPGSPTSI